VAIEYTEGGMALYEKKAQTKGGVNLYKTKGEKRVSCTRTPPFVREKDLGGRKARFKEQSGEETMGSHPNQIAERGCGSVRRVVGK